jgi:hypothetical protein
MASGSALRTAATVVAHVLMLAAVLLLWNSDAPQFIYVAF